MIINGNSRSNGIFFAKHLMNAEKNERVTVCEIKNLAAQSVRDAFMEMKAASLGTKCDNYFFHANIDPRHHERMTPEQWEKATNELEKNLGLEGQPRFVVEHAKGDSTHRHVIWSRIDVDNQCAISDSLTAKVCHETADALNIEYGFERVKSPYTREPNEPRPDRAPKSWETHRVKEGEMTPQQVTKVVTGLFRQSDNGPAFHNALEETGYKLCEGDRRGYCIFDKAGHIHSLAKRIDGVNTAELKEFMKDVPLADLPKAKDVQAQLNAEKPRSKTARAMTEAFNAASSAAEIKKHMAENGLHMACVTRDDALASEKRREDAEQVQGAKKQPLLKEGEFVAVNRYGDIHRFTKHMTGLSSAEIADRMKGVDKGTMPDIDAATLKARNAPRHKSEQPKRSLNEQRLYNAFQNNENAADTVKALDEFKIGFSRVTADDARASQKRHDDARAINSQFVPKVLAEGEIVAVSYYGDIFQLNQHTTGKDHKDAAARFSDKHRSAMPSVEQRLKDHADRREAKINSARGADIADRGKKAFAKATVTLGSIIWDGLTMGATRSEAPREAAPETDAEKSVKLDEAQRATKEQAGPYSSENYGVFSTDYTQGHIKGGGRSLKQEN